MPVRPGLAGRRNRPAESDRTGPLAVATTADRTYEFDAGATITAGANVADPTGIVTTVPLMPITSYERPELARNVASMPMVSATEDARANRVADEALADVTTELVDAQFVGVHEDAMHPGMHGATVVWFRYELMGDVTARAQFYPPTACGLCRDAAWMRLRHKN